MRTIDEIKQLISELSVRRDEHLNLAEKADTYAGEKHFIALAESDIDWIEALEWVLNEN